MSISDYHIKVDYNPNTQCYEVILSTLPYCLYVDYKIINIKKYIFFNKSFCQIEKEIKKAKRELLKRYNFKNKAASDENSK